MAGRSSLPADSDLSIVLCQLKLGRKTTKPLRHGLGCFKGWGIVASWRHLSTDPESKQQPQPLSPESERDYTSAKHEHQTAPEMDLLYNSLGIIWQSPTHDRHRFRNIARKAGLFRQKPPPSSSDGAW